MTQEKIKFKEIETKSLNNGWTMGLGFVVGAGGSAAVGIGAAALLT